MNPEFTLCTWFETYSHITTNFSALPAESLPLSASAGRVVAQPLTALADLPAYATSSMDGFAVAGAGPWRIVGEVTTGHSSEYTLSSGECLRISTGGVIPAGCTAVIPWEDAHEDAGAVSGAVETGANIRPAATEAAQGEVLIDAGTTLLPTHIGLLAATGHDSVNVVRRPRVAVLLLGDELIHQGLPHSGLIRDSLGVQLPAYLEACGAEVVMLTFLKDNPASIKAAVSQALDQSDLIITTGGTADGPKDFAKFIIETFSMNFVIDRVRMRPGYHFLLSTVRIAEREVAYIALPGNPQSAIASLTSFGVPLLDVMSGRTPKQPGNVVLGKATSTPADFARLILGHVVDGVFYEGSYLGSAMLRGLAASDGFALVSPGNHPAGAPAHWITLPFR